MSTVEVIDAHRLTDERGWDLLGVRLFWTDDHSNFAGVYVDGPMRGRVCFIEVGAVNLAPEFRCVYDFATNLTWAIDNRHDWRHIRRVYHANNDAKLPSGMSEIDTINGAPWLPDLVAVEQLRGLLHRCDDGALRTQYKYCLMALVPADEAHTLLEFTMDEDALVQAFSCRVIAERRYTGAVNRLLELTESSIQAVRQAALQALSVIERPD